MIEFLLVCAIGVIVFLVINKKDIARPQVEEDLRNENDFLRIKLNEKLSDIQSRENNLNTTIKELQSSISKHQSASTSIIADFKKKEETLIFKTQNLEKKLEEETLARKKVLSQKKSGEVRLGHIAETLAPFLDQFDFEPERCSFLGQPIDYISFGDDEITFIEVKSGNSQLSQKQRHIRDLVKAKLVSWKEVRIK
jgi:predicted Holliday junction resolvase-like endonuclease